MELSYILGNSPEVAVITLFSFLQQNILFDALSGKLTGNSLGAIVFLEEVSLTFGMIGMLVLIFSPHLWKVKIIVSWFFIFLCLVIGAATGGTFGYAFSDATGKEFLSKSAQGTNLNCTKSTLVNGYCEDELKTDSLAFEYLNSDSIADTIKKQPSLIDTDKIDEEDTKVVGFYPQVFILYITNRFKSNLEYALYDLNTRNFNRRKMALNKMLNARLPNYQVGMWAYAFDFLCSSKVSMNTPDLLANGIQGITAEERSNLAASHFIFKDLVPLVRYSSLIESNNPRVIAPLIDFVSPSTGNSNKQSYILQNINEFLKNPNSTLGVSSSDALRWYTINYPDKAKGWFGEIVATVFSSNGSTNNISDSSSLISYPSMNNQNNKPDQQLINRFDDSMAHRYKNDRKYSEASRILANSKLYDVPSYLIMPTYYATRTDTIDFNVNKESLSTANLSQISIKGNNGCWDFTSSNSCGLSYLEGTNVQGNAIPTGNFSRVSNCLELLNGVNEYYTTMLKTEINQYGKSLDIISKLNQNQATQNLILNAQSNGLEAHRAFLEQLTVRAKQCETISNTTYNLTNASSNVALQTCTNLYIDPILKHYKSAAMSNFLVTTKRNMSEYFEKHNNSLVNGGTGLSYNVGEFMVEAFDGPLAGLLSIGKAFQAGAYSAILPIIKNIIIAFILICTPILLLIGLLVPSWAPGVIVTSLISLLFLQMTDIIMVVVQTILVSVEQPMKQLVMSANDVDQSVYQNFLEVIWAMAYMSTFAITAFFMFAAGNTKAIMGKLAGLDGTIQSVSKDIYQTGWKMTKQGIGMIAPGMGNTMISSTGAFNSVTGAIAGAKNIASGNSAGTVAEWGNAINSKQLSGMQENDNIRDNNFIRENKVTGQMEADAIADYKEKRHIIDEQNKVRSEKSRDEKINMFKEKVEQAKDDIHASFIDSFGDQTSRADNKKSRLKEVTKAEANKVQDYFGKTVDTAIKDGFVDEAVTRNNTFTKNVDGTLVTYNQISPVQDMKKNALEYFKKDLGYDYNLSKPSAPREGASSEERKRYDQDLASFETKKAENLRILREANSLASTAVHSSMRHMSKDNIRDEGDKRFIDVDYSNIGRDISKSLSNKNMDNFGNLQRVNGFFANRYGVDPNSNENQSLEYREELKNVKSKKSTENNNDGSKTKEKRNKKNKKKK